MHGVEREHPAAQPERGDQGLHCRDFVRLLVDHLVGKDDLMVDRERAENMRRLAVRESVKALPQRLPQFSLNPKNKVAYGVSKNAGRRATPS